MVRLRPPFYDFNFSVLFPQSRPDAMSRLTDQLDRFLRRSPTLGRGVFLAKTAVVLGDVTLGDFASVWFGAVLRGDINRIVVGEGSNIQDNAVVHLADDDPAIIGRYVTVGHSAIIHACTIGDECLIGMGATILDGAVIGHQCIVGANALVTQKTQVPDGSLVLGSPAKVVKALSAEQRAGLKYWADKYVENAAYCLKHGLNVGAPLPS
jgi:carbonic anhydrase/acetyltransferase-like protein (isoleucine patch superfamily)